MRARLLLGFFLTACGQSEPSLEIRVIAAGATNPLGAATSVRTRLVDAQNVILAETTFAVAKRQSGFADPVPFATARAVVEGLDGNGEAVARGSSRLHDLDDPHIDVNLNVFVGGLDTFWKTIDTAGTPTVLSNPVVAPTATALEDGTVLIAGGARLDSTGGIAEISNHAYVYDPDTGRFAELPRMKQARAMHTATALRPDGAGRKFVLLAGGITVINDQVQSSATLEVYDPVSRRFDVLRGTLTEARAFHSATLLLDGGVLFAGGIRVKPVPMASLPVLEELQPQSAPTVLEKFDGTSSVAALGAFLEAGRWAHGAVRANQAGQVVFVGGRGNNGQALASTTVFSAKDGSVKLGQVLSGPRAGCAVVRVADDRVLVIGGSADVDDPSKTVATTDWLSAGVTRNEVGPLLRAPRAHATATLLSGGRVLVIGGIGLDGQSRSDAEMLTDGSDNARLIPNSLAHARARHAAAMLPGDTVLLVGGATISPSTTSVLGQGEVYVDPLPKM